MTTSTLPARRASMGGLPAWVAAAPASRGVSGAAEERRLVLATVVLYGLIATWARAFPGLLPGFTRGLTGFWDLGGRLSLEDAAGFPLPLILRLPSTHVDWVARHGVDRALLAVVASALLAHVACASVQSLGFSRRQRVTLVLSVMLNPVTILYGTGRPEEALLVAAIAMAIHQVARWATAEELSPFVVAAMAFGVAAVTGRAGLIAGAAFVVPVVVNAVLTRRGRQGRTTALVIAYVLPIIFAVGLTVWLSTLVTEQQQIGLLGSAYGSIWDAYFAGLPGHLGRMRDGLAVRLVALDALLIAPSLAVATATLAVASVRRASPVPVLVAAATLVALLALAALSVDAGEGYATLQPAGAAPLGFVLGMMALGCFVHRSTPEFAARLRPLAVAIGLLTTFASTVAVAAHWGTFA